MCRLLSGDIDGASKDIIPVRNDPKMATAGSLVYLGMLGIKAGRRDEGIRDLEAFAQYSRSARTDFNSSRGIRLGRRGRPREGAPQASLEADANCSRLVASSIAFQSVRSDPTVQHVIARYGVR